MHYFSQNSLHYLHYFELLSSRSFTIRIQTVELRARFTTKGYFHSLFPFVLFACKDCSMTMALNTVTVSSKYKYTGIVTMYLGGVEYKILYPTLLSQMLSFIHHFIANDGIIMLQSIVKETCF